jgi:hypothetical protein
MAGLPNGRGLRYHTAPAMGTNWAQSPEKRCKTGKNLQKRVA